MSVGSVCVLGEPGLELLVDARVLERRREKTNISLKIVMFDSQEYCQERPQGLKNGENEHSRI